MKTAAITLAAFVMIAQSALAAPVGIAPGQRNLRVLQTNLAENIEYHPSRS